MVRDRSIGCAALIAVSLLVVAGAEAQPKPPPPPKAGKPERAAGGPGLEPKAIAILTAMSQRLAAAKSMVFTAVATYESPTRSGFPLAYTTISEVTLRRPDKLRVITPYDGPASEFYYDGKTMTAFAPEENVAAVADAPPTIDAALKAAYDSAAIYFPFTDVIVADPYKDIADGLQMAYVIGQSRVVGGTKTDMIAIANDRVFAQVWIGAEDKLPRMVRAVYAADPLRLRNQVELSNWRMNAAISDDAWGSPRTGAASRIQFARPDPKPPAGSDAPAKGEPAATPQPK